MSETDLTTWLLAQYDKDEKVGREAEFPCDTLRLLALPYAHRPGYDPAWAPECTVRGTPEPPTS